MLLAVLGSRRPTGDVDLLARAIDNDVEAIADVVRTVLSVTVESLPAEGLDDHLGHRLVPERRWVVGKAGDAEHVLGALRPLL
jgi:hypothetical protein